MRSQTRSSLLGSFRPQLVHLTHNLTAAVFPLMKVFPAAFCLERAEKEHLISHDSVIVETSSGTMALGLALACNWSGYRLIVVSDTACDDALKRRIQDLGAEVQIVPRPAAVGGFQRARLNLVAEICARSEKYWWVNQYDNVANAASYSVCAAQFTGELGRIDCLVGSVGSGGSVCGSSSHLRLLFPDLHVIGVDTFGSVLFGQPDGPRQLRGLGNSLLPKNLDHTCFDDVHWVSVEEAYTMTRILHRTTGLYRGGTSGACWMVARHWAEQNPGKRVLCLFPDDGHRYSNSIYNDDEMHANGHWLANLPGHPREVSTPECAGPRWSFMRWRRRQLSEVVGEPCLLTATA